MKSLVRWAARLFPRDWRARYGAEFEALLDDIRPGWRGVLNVARAAMAMRMAAMPWKALAVFALAGLLMAGAVVYGTPDRYVSAAVLRVTAAPGKSAQDQLADELHSYLSRGSLIEVISRPGLDLYKLERRSGPLEDIVEKMRRNILVQPAGDGTAIESFRVGFTYPNREKARLVAEALAERFTRWDRRDGSSVEVVSAAGLPQAPLPRQGSVGVLLLGVAGGLATRAVMVTLRRWRQGFVWGMTTAIAVTTLSYWMAPDRYRSSAVLLASDRATVDQLRQAIGRMPEQGLSLRPAWLPVSGGTRQAVELSFTGEARPGRFFPDSDVPVRTRKTMYTVVDRLMELEQPKIEVLDAASFPEEPIWPNRWCFFVPGLLIGLVAQAAVHSRRLAPPLPPK